MDKIAKPVEKIATGSNLAIAIMVFVVGSMIWFNVGPMERLGSEGILDDDWGFNYTQAVNHLEGLGPDGRDDYRTFLWLDLAYSLIWLPVGTLAIAAATRTWVKLRWARPVLIFPVISVVLDWIENGFLLAILGGYPEPNSAAVTIASGVSQVKLALVSALMGLSVAIAVALLLRAMWNPVKRKRAYS